jgi:hypothetical protein
MGFAREGRLSQAGERWKQYVDLIETPDRQAQGGRADVCTPLLPTAQSPSTSRREGPSVERVALVMLGNEVMTINQHPL